jgi:hypothetical protein
MQMQLCALQGAHNVVCPKPWPTKYMPRLNIYKAWWVSEHVNKKQQKVKNQKARNCMLKKGLF